MCFQRHCSKQLCCLRIFSWHLCSAPDSWVPILINITRQVLHSILRPIIHVFCKFESFRQVGSVMLRWKQRGSWPGFVDPQRIFQTLPHKLRATSGQSNGRAGSWSSLLCSTQAWDMIKVTVWFLYAISIYCLLFAACNDVLFKQS